MEGTLIWRNDSESPVRAPKFSSPPGRSLPQNTHCFLKWLFILLEHGPFITPWNLVLKEEAIMTNGAWSVTFPKAVFHICVG